ncbi:hypothetical protein GCM10011369_29260 [Neiella marina]|uniref:Uncharacterized protein n=1 Tax=Neiella marina TaxID=508461 RepID=A0A8J2U8G0_9GAMM|nr:hypothetical protein GCM10011369_29260 [Neiella marina]
MITKATHLPVIFVKLFIVFPLPLCARKVGQNSCRWENVSDERTIKKQSKMKTTVPQSETKSVQRR